jgi:hypothetical protein
MMHGRRAWAAVGVLGVGVACGQINPPSSSSGATSNTCPDHPCSAYAQGAAPLECVNGACLVTQANYTSLVLVVDVPVDNTYAPGQTYAVALDEAFLKNSALPAPVAVRGDLLVTPAQRVDVNFNLGNPGLGTALPMQATFRRLWQVGSAQVEASSVGLPFLPTAASSVEYPATDPGPFGVPALTFEAALQPGLYERTIMPEPPLDRAFPPAIDIVDVEPNAPFDVSLSLDVTMSEACGTTFPQFCVSRCQAGLGCGSVDGWSAYLRDATTKRRVSNLGSLSPTACPTPQGASCTTTPPLQLFMTDHHPASGDALDKAQLVVVPPEGANLPTYVLAPQAGVLKPDENYAPLPSPTKVEGYVTSGGSFVRANLIFEATAIYETTGPNTAPNTTNYEYTARVSTGQSCDGAVAGGSADAGSVDSGGGGAPPNNESGAVTSTSAFYCVTLPAGVYRVTVRPVDLSAEVTVIPAVAVPSQPFLTQPFDLQPQPQVSGIVTLTDARTLAGATVEAIPTQCSRTTTTPWCMPRPPAPTTTAGDGTFTLSLDEGSYLLRVRPADGSSLPWVVQSVLVTPRPTQLMVSVPAPFYISPTLTLENNPVSSAVVRVFDTSQPLAAEVGRTITDAYGHFQMYIAPPTQ